MANNTLIGVDLAKSVFEIVVPHHPGKVAARRLSREQFLSFLVQRPSATRLTLSRQWRPHGSAGPASRTAD